jgi:hypothetical protein
MLRHTHNACLFLEQLATEAIAAMFLSKIYGAYFGMCQLLSVGGDIRHK